VKPNDTYNQGRVIPLKFKLTDALGKNVSNVTATVSIVYKGDDPNVVIPAHLSSTEVLAGNTFRLADKKYMYNLDTKELALGSYDLVVTLHVKEP
jgi:hypothetical protein